MKEKTSTTAAEGVWAFVTHATPLKRDAMYDHRAQQGALGIELHHTDGRTTPSVLVLTRGQVELYAAQFDRLLTKRKHSIEAEQQGKDVRRS